MPHPKGNMKSSGDIHLPDVESDLAVEQGHTGLEYLANERSSGRTVARKAGLLADPDLETTTRLPHVTRGEAIEPGTEPLAGYQAPRLERRRAPVSLKSLGLAFLAGVLLYRLVR